MMTQKSPKISKNNVNSIYHQTCSECNDEVIDQLRPKMKMMTNDDKWWHKNIQNHQKLFSSVHLAGAGRFARTPAIRTDLFNGSIQPVLLDRLDGRYHSSLPKNQCSIPNGLRWSGEGRSPHIKYGKYAGRPTFGILFWEI